MTYRGYIVVSLIVIVSFSLAAQASAACVAVTRTLSRGSSGKEVVTLQRFLNSDPETQIAIAGKNSPGEESGVFDAATVKAVKAFQQKNKASILTPNGLTQPNGVVGRFTRDVLKQQLCGSAADNKFFITTPTTPAPIPSAEALANQKRADALKARMDNIINVTSLQVDAKIDALNAKALEVQKKIDEVDKGLVVQEEQQRLVNILSSGDSTMLAPAFSGNFGKSDPLRLIFISPANVHRGERIALAGTGFLEKNIVRGGDQVLDSGTPNASGTVLYVTLPSSIANGKVGISVENTKGKSAIKYITVVDGGIPPHINAVSPKNPTIGGMVTIAGDHFAQSNDVITTYGPIKSVGSSDGRTLSFKLTPELLSVFGTMNTKNIPFSIGVVNESGVSNTLTLSLQ